MCPICLGTAAWATMAGTGSAGGLAAFVAVKLRLKHHEVERDVSPGGMDGPAPEVQTEGDGK